MASFNAQRMGDANTAGGIATDGAASVIINGKRAGIPGVKVTPHVPCPTVPIHCSAVTVSSCQSVIIEGKPALRTSIDIDTCGHARAGGSVDVLIGE